MSEAGAPRETRDEQSRLAGVDELARLDRVEGGEADSASPISSASAPPGPKATRGPRSGPAGHGEQLGAAREERLDDHRAADATRRLAHLACVAKVDGDPAELGLAAPGSAVLTTAGKPSSVANATASSGSAATRSGTSGIP